MLVAIIAMTVTTILLACGVLKHLIGHMPIDIKIIRHLIVTVVFNFPLPAT